MRINAGDTVQCHDQNIYDIDKVDKSYAYGYKIIPKGDKIEISSSERLFKLNGQYAGGDRTKNVAKVL